MSSGMLNFVNGGNGSLYSAAVYLLHLEP